MNFRLKIILLTMLCAACAGCAEEIVISQTNPVIVENI